MARPSADSRDDSDSPAAARQFAAPVAALVTAPGRAALATIQIHSPGALAAVAACCGCSLDRARARLHGGRLWLTHWGLEPVVVHAPSDGQVEVTCHGGPVSVDAILGDLCARGIAVVPWESIVRRTAVSLIQAEAAEALAHAGTLRAAAILLDQFHGALDRAIARLGDAAQRGDWEQVCRGLRELSDRAACGLHLVEPWRVVLVGRPNNGKSSLLNCLVGFPRAIAHETPGTTRDLITARTALDGWPIELCDTAGVRRPGDEIEAAGVERTRQAIAGSDCQIVVLDRNRPLEHADREILALCSRPVLAANKSDLPAAWTEAQANALVEGIDRAAVPLVHVSAQTRSGVDQLLSALSRRLVPEPPAARSAVPFTRRQCFWIAAAQGHLERRQIEAAAGALIGLTTMQTPDGPLKYSS